MRKWPNNLKNYISIMVGTSPSTTSSVLVLIFFGPGTGILNLCAGPVSISMYFYVSISMYVKIRVDKHRSIDNT